METENEPQRGRRNESPLLFMLQELQSSQLETRSMIGRHVAEEDRRFDDILNKLTQLHGDRIEQDTIGRGQKRHRVDSDLWPLRFLSILMYIFAGFGIMLHTQAAARDDMRYLFEIMSPSHWVAISFAIAIIRCGGLLIRERSTSVRVLVPCLALWFWTVLFVSSAIKSPLEGMSLMYIVPFAIEFWLLLQAFRQGRTVTWIT